MLGPPQLGMSTNIDKRNLQRFIQKAETGRFMELSYGVTFGKKSKTVTRAGDKFAEEVQVPETQHPRTSTATDAVLYQYPGYVGGHAKRNDFTKDLESVMYEDDGTHKLKSRKRTFSSGDFDHLFSPLSSDDLPHPSKMRKHGNKKLSKVSRNLEKQMCVDYHLQQLRQRNQKYLLCKKEMTNPNKDCELQSQELYPAESNNKTMDTLDQVLGPNVLKSSGQSNLSVQSPPNYLPAIDIQHSKKQAKSKQLMFPPGSVLLGTASLEQEEEERWFRQLWKPKNKSRCIEE